MTTPITLLPSLPAGDGPVLFERFVPIHGPFAVHRSSSFLHGVMMDKNAEATPNVPVEAIRITGLNMDKTRRADTSGPLYNIYFELSDNPSQGWKEFFQNEWATVTARSSPAVKLNDAAVDRGFLVVHASLDDVASVYLPALKASISSANALYADDCSRRERTRSVKEQAWQEERAQVEKMASTLTFD